MKKIENNNINYNNINTHTVSKEKFLDNVYLYDYEYKDIADELYISKTMVRTYINDIYFEIGLMASFNNLINKSIMTS